MSNFFKDLFAIASLAGFSIAALSWMDFAARLA
jgi:hypothetical protein